jgi:hypothetical protein
MIPRSPTTIANIAALVADGHLYGFSPPGESLLADLDHVEGCFGENAVFRLGWRAVPGREEELFSIYVGGDAEAS